jgi:hypothetical protein
MKMVTDGEKVLSSSFWLSFFSALLRLESKLIVAAREFVTYELGKTLRTRKIRKIPDRKPYMIKKGG